MVVATVALLFAALARWTFVGSGLARAGIWLSPIFVGTVHDWITRRRIHPVYTIESIALFLFALRLLVAGSETWLRIGRPIFGLGLVSELRMAAHPVWWTADLGPPFSDRPSRQ